MKILGIILLFLISSVGFGQVYKVQHEIHYPKNVTILNQNLNFEDKFAHTYLLGNYKMNLKILIKVKKPKPYKKVPMKNEDLFKKYECVLMKT